MRITTGELIDRMSIVWRKCYYGGDDFIDEYNEIRDELKSRIKKMKLSVDTIEAIIQITNINADIWNNEDFVRKGEFEKFSESEQLKRLKFTHALNDKRARAKSRINESVGEMRDKKVY